MSDSEPVNVMVPDRRHRGERQPVGVRQREGAIIHVERHFEHVFQLID